MIIVLCARLPVSYCVRKITLDVSPILGLASSVSARLRLKRESSRCEYIKGWSVGGGAGVHEGFPSLPGSSFLPYKKGETCDVFRVSFLT